MALIEVQRGRLAGLMRMAARLAKDAPVTGNREAYLLSNYFELDSLARGDNLLDICAGLSRTTEVAVARGIDAIAVDAGYGDIEGLARRAKDRKVDPAFLAFAKQNPRRFRQAFAHDLPFADGTFRKVVSFYGIFGVIDENPFLAEASINEAIRVSRTGGTLELSPFMTGTISERQMFAQAYCLDQLRERGDVAVSVDFAPKYPLVSRRGDPPLAKLAVTKLA